MRPACPPTAGRPQAGLEIDRVCLPTFPLVPVLRRLLPTVYCLPTFPLVTCHSSLVTAFRREEAADLKNRSALLASDKREVCNFGIMAYHEGLDSPQRFRRQV
jgi:hypothetical protein